MLLAAAALPAPAAAQEQAVAVAAQTPEVRRERAEHPGAYLRAFREPRRWRVSLYAPPRGEEVAEVLVDDRGRVLEAWTGVQAQWPMARGYPGQFGRAANTTWLWVALSGLFVLPFLRGPPRMLHLDLAVLLAFGISYAFFNAAEIGVSVPSVYPLLVYLLGRMLWVAWHPPPAAPALRVGPAFLMVALMVLIGVRIALNLEGNVIDVGIASVEGADRLAAGEPLYGALANHGDTYGPALYAAYVPFELVLEPRAAAHAAALAFDLGCLLVLWRLGGLLLAYLWAAYPFTLLVSASGANDSLVALLVLSALLAWRRPAACGALTALAGLTKLAPLALAPLLVGRRPVAIGAFAAVLAVALAPFDVETLLDRTLGFQADRDSPFSIWGGADLVQLAVQIAAVALAVAVAFVPRRRDLGTVAALAAAVLIAVQLGVDHWFYLYLVWFAPLTWIALLGVEPARSPRPNAVASS